MALVKWPQELPNKNTRKMVDISGGLNSRFSSPMIGESQASVLTNLRPEIDGTLLAETKNVIEDVTSYFKATNLICLGATGFNDGSNYGIIVALGAQSVTPPNYDFTYIHVYEAGSGLSVTIDVNALLGSTPMLNPTQQIDIAQFNTATKQVYILNCPSFTNPLELSNVFGTVALSACAPPVTLSFRSGCSHANRMFYARDNVLWWTKAGTDGAASGDWYGTTTPANYVTEDNGYWVLEKDKTIKHLVRVGDALLIFTEQNIYRFYGYAPENFSLGAIYNGIGAADFKQWNKPCVLNNKVWFIFSNYVYEYSLDSVPVVINEPVPVAGGGVSVGGGFNLTDFDATVIYITMCVDDTYLYVHMGHTTMRFNHLTRKWNKVYGFERTTVSNPALIERYDCGRYIDDLGNMHPVFAVTVQAYGSGVFTTYVSPEIPFCNGAMEYVSKAISAGPFSISYLLSAWVQYIVPAATAAEVYVYAADGESGSSWDSLASKTIAAGTGLIVTERCLVPRNLVKLVTHYRVRIVCTGVSQIFPLSVEERVSVR